MPKLGGRASHRPAVLGALLLMGLSAAGIMLAGSAFGSTGSGSSSTQSWNFSASSLSTLSVEFRANESDPRPRVAYQVDVGFNRTPDNRSFAAAHVWNATGPVWGEWHYVNEGAESMGVQIRDRSLLTSPPFEDLPTYEECPCFDGSVARELAVGPEIQGNRFELTLFATPSSPMSVELSMPGGGKVLDVDRNPGDVKLTPFERFDEWEGTRSVPGATKFHEANQTDGPTIAIGEVAQSWPSGAGRYEFHTPEGCEATNTYLLAPTLRIQEPEVDCPPGADPYLEFGIEDFMYRGTKGGPVQLNATATDRHGGLLSFLVTAEFPEE